MTRQPKPTPRSDALGGTKGRILKYLERNPTKWFTPKQLAKWTGLTERTVLKHLSEMKIQHHVEEDESD